MRGLFLLLSILTVVNLGAYETSLHMNRKPKRGECYPDNPSNKKYLLIKDATFYKRRVFTCNYICVDLQGNTQSIVGTSDIRDWLEESGRSFVCEGYRETMKYVETPGNPDRWGYWDINGVTPFHPLSKKVPELKNWYRKNIGLDKMTLYLSQPEF